MFKISQNHTKRKMSVINPNPSLYIHHAHKGTTKERVFAAFCKLNVGHIECVDEISRVNGNKEFKSFFIHFSHWFDTTLANEFKDKISMTKDGKNHRERVYIFDTAVYWNVTKSNQPKPSLAPEISEETDTSTANEEIIAGKRYTIRSKMEHLSGCPLASVKYIKEKDEWVMYVVWTSNNELARKKIN